MEQYTLRVLVDDSAVKKLQQRIESIMGISTGGATGTTAQTGPSLFKNLTKLSAIAAGIGGSVALLKKLVELAQQSSPLLQSMTKLFDTSIMFIFRPIGDFIALLLRPFVVLMLRYAVNFYKSALPQLVKIANAMTTGDWLGAGKTIGEWRTDILRDVFGLTENHPLIKFLRSWERGKEAFWRDPSKYFDEIAKALMGLSGGIIKGIKTWIDTQWKNVDTAFGGLAGKINRSIRRIGELFSKINIGESFWKAWNSFISFIASLKVSETLSNLWGDAIKFLTSTGESFVGPIRTALDKVLAFFQSIIDFFNKIPEWIKGWITPQEQQTSSKPTGSSNWTINFGGIFAHGIDKASAFAGQIGDELMNVINTQLKGR